MNKINRINHSELIDSILADFERVRQINPHADPVSEAEVDRRRNLMYELMAETERLGLYK